jgi:hypothetical protein
MFSALSPRQRPHASLSPTAIPNSPFLCESGVDFEKTDQKMTWKVTNVFDLCNFIDFAGGVIPCQTVSVSEVVWVKWMLREAGGGTGVVEIYHH